MANLMRDARVAMTASLASFQPFEELFVSQPT